MEANSSQIIKYHLNDLDWDDMWHIYNGLELLLSKCSSISEKTSIGDMMNEIKRITNTR